MKRTAKALIVLMAALIIFILVPCAVYAAEESISWSAGEVYIVKEEAGVYRIGESTSSDLSELIRTAVPDGSTIIFDGVSSKSALYIEGNMTVGGVLTLDGGMVFEGNSLSLDGITLSLGAPIRVKYGKAELLSGSISSVGSAVVLDYSSGASFTARGGSISTSCVSEPAVLLSVGAVNILGAEVSNELGTAILSYSELTVASDARIVGARFDIETSVPIRLSHLSDYFDGELSVRWLSDFEDGSFTEVFLRAEAFQVGNIELYDRLNRPTALSYFERSDYTDEKNFIAVSRPFEAVYYVGEKVYHRCEYINGEIPEAPGIPERLGYSFDGWYTERGFENRYTFSTAPNSDITLYAKSTLSAPSFGISSLSFEYDGKERRLSFSELSHPLMSGGSFSYDWYKDGEALNLSSPFVPLCEVCDSGDYICKLTFSYDGDYAVVQTPPINVSISKMKLSIPEISPSEYSGKKQACPLPDTEFYRVSSDGGCDVGEYPVLLTLTDPDNCEWVGSSGDTAELAFCITRAQNRFLSVSAEDIYEGDMPKICAELLFGEYSAYYSSDGVNFTPNIPTGAGVVYLMLSSEATLNYTSAKSEVISFKVKALECVGIRIESMPSKLVYYPFETPDLTGLSLMATMNSGEVREVRTEDVTVIFKNGKYLSGADTSVTLAYGGSTVPMPIEVLTLEYDISDVVFGDTESVYDGNYHSIAPTVEVTGLDGSRLSYKVIGGGTDVGVYNVTLVFYTDSPSYKAPASISAKLTVTPLCVTVEYENTEFVYDGSPKVPRASYKNAFGIRIPISLSGKATDAGEYTATAEISDGNYRIINPTVAFRIAKRSFDLSEFVWSSGSYVYSSLPRSVELVSVPDGITVSGYIDAVFTNVGKYTAKAKLIYDEKNYNAPPDVTLSWQICAAEYDMSDFEFLNTEVVYDGFEHYPKVSGAIPTGLDGSVLRYTFSRSVKNVADGCVVIRVDFSTESSNYKTPEARFVTLTVLPKPVTVTWSCDSFIYDGTSHIPSASAAECALTVTGYGIDAGEYIAYAASEDSNYKVRNCEFAFTVHKAANEWLTLPWISDIYESGRLSPYATSKYGTVRFNYYLDAECKSAVELPVAAGEYYLVASVGEGKNYLPLSSFAIKFKIIPVMPRELIANIDGEQTAMSTLPDTFKVTLINNDGSVKELSLSDITVEYQSADGFRYGDTYLTIRYKDISKRLSVKVVRAVYDMSGVIWISTHHVYDGSAKFAELSGLPEGVSVISYSGNGAVGAGSYPLGVSLSYDTENYYEPIVPLCSLVIEKRSLELPDVPPVKYDGKYHEPSIPESPLYTVDVSGGVNAGKYPICITLGDPDNYELPPEPFVFEIQPIELTVRVLSDGRSYRIESGALLLSDTLDEEYYTENGLVYMRSSNGNYKLTVIPSSRAASANRVWLGIIIFLSVSLLSLTVIIIVRYPDKLRALGERLREGMKRPVVSGADIPQSSKTLLATDKEHANSMISDTTAKALIGKSRERIKTSGNISSSVAVDAICAAFDEGSEVNINSLKEKGLIPENANRVHIVASGVIDKPLSVCANSFELAAVKMIALTGGKATRSRTARK